MNEYTFSILPTYVYIYICVCAILAALKIPWNRHSLFRHDPILDPIRALELWTRNTGSGAPENGRLAPGFDDGISHGLWRLFFGPMDPQKWIHWKVMSAFLTLWSQFLDDSQIYINLLLTATIWIIFLLLDLVGIVIPQMIWMAQPPEPLQTIADSLLFQSQAQVRNWPVRNLQNWWFSGLVPSIKPA